MRYLLLLSLLLAGCAKVPPTHYYLLDAPVVESASTLVVAPFEVVAPFDQERIVYRERDSAEVGFYAYHRWAVPLEEMLPRVIAALLAEDPRFGELDTGARLSGRVVDFGEIDEAGTPLLRFRIELRLDSDAGSVWNGSIASERAVDATSVDRLVQELSNALADEIDAIREELLEAFAGA